MRLSMVLGLAAVMVGNCAFAPPDGTEEFNPPAHYREIWADAEKCSGFHGDFDKIHWYVVPGHDFKADGVQAIGHWNSPHEIAIAHDWLTTDWVVRHEMLHDLTGWPHDNGPRDIEYWGRRCHCMWGYLESTDSTYKP